MFRYPRIIDYSNTLLQPLIDSMEDKNMNLLKLMNTFKGFLYKLGFKTMVHVTCCIGNLSSLGNHS